jgi:hypothetical protein
MRVALEAGAALAGVKLPRRDGLAQRSPARPRPAPHAAPVRSLSAGDLDERKRALRLAALHYGFLAWGGDEGAPSAAEHLAYLVEMAGMAPADAEATLRGRTAALAYAAQRGLCPLARRPLTALLGCCPHWRTGLREYLRLHGGPEVVEAARRAGLWKEGRNGAAFETMRGRLVFVWSDERGTISYLTGRAVPDLADACALRDEDGQLVKSYALRVWRTDGANGVGMPAPVAPFGLCAAGRLVSESRPFVVVEGEIDAIGALLAGWPGVATGGTGRMSGAVVAAALGGRPAVVCPDRDSDPRTRAETERRAGLLAEVLGARVARLPGGL